MPQQTYQGQLYDLRADVLVMSEDVGEQLDRAISSIKTLKYFVDDLHADPNEPVVVFDMNTDYQDFSKRRTCR